MGHLTKCEWGAVPASLSDAKGCLAVDVQEYATAQDMMQSTCLKTGYAHTLGFYEVGDGGAAYYTITDQGEPNGMDVLRCAKGYVAELIPGEWVTPEQFGAKDGTDISKIIMSAIEKTNVFLNEKEYIIENTIDIKDIENRTIKGVCPANFTGGSLTKCSKLICKNMNGKSAINVQGCLNVNVEDLYIGVYNNDPTHTPLIGVYKGRTVNHLSSHWCDMRGVGIRLPSDIELNKENGTIGIYNNAAEQFKIVDCSIEADTCVANTQRDFINIANKIGGYNYGEATCTVFTFDNVTLGGSTAFLSGNTASVSIIKCFHYDPFKNRDHSVFMKGLFTNETGKYWTNYTVDSHSEQVVNPKIFQYNDNLHFINSHIKYYYASVYEDLIDGYSNSSTINNYFQITTSRENIAPIADMSNTTATFFNNMIIGPGIIAPLGSTSNYNIVNRNGSFGPSGLMAPNWMPFKVNSVQIGSYETIPTQTEGITEGALCLASVNAGLTWAWVFKNGQWRALTYNE